MKTEYEVKILDIAVDKIKCKLDSLGAKFVGRKDFKRNVFDVRPKKKNSWLRLRTDGSKTTLTVK